MKYLVHTRGDIQTIRPQHRYAVISIGTPGDAEVALCENEFCHGVLRLWFDDADRNYDEASLLVLLRTGDSKDAEPIRFFDVELADRILDFWSQLRREPDFAALYIHCHAGYSRSPAVAAALQKIETGDDAYWFAGKSPNMLVYRTILNRAFERGIHNP